MKKFTGTLLITAALLTHVAFTVAMEDSYTFSSSDYSSSPSTQFENASSGFINPSHVIDANIGAGLINAGGLYSVESEFSNR
jgi:hypothetical protein